MRRRSLLGILFGGSAVAQVPLSSENGSVNPWSRRKPQPGECPVCGTRAPDYIRPTSPKIVPCFPPEPADSEITCVAPGDSYGQKEIMVACANCRVLFMQAAK